MTHIFYGSPLSELKVPRITHPKKPSVIPESTQDLAGLHSERIEHLKEGWPDWMASPAIFSHCQTDINTWSVETDPAYFFDDTTLYSQHSLWHVHTKENKLQFVRSEYLEGQKQKADEEGNWGDDEEHILLLINSESKTTAMLITRRDEESCTSEFILPRSLSEDYNKLRLFQLSEINQEPQQYSWVILESSPPPLSEEEKRQRALNFEAMIDSWFMLLDDHVRSPSTNALLPPLQPTRTTLSENDILGMFGGGREPTYGRQSMNRQGKENLQAKQQNRKNTTTNQSNTSHSTSTPRGKNNDISSDVIDEQQALLDNIKNGMALEKNAHSINDKRYLCMVCEGLFSTHNKHTWQSNCGNRFCLECYTTIKSENKECPEPDENGCHCSKDNGYIIDNGTTRDVKKLPIKCKNCDIELKYRELEHHLEMECSRTFRNCVLCTECISANKTQEHLKQDHSIVETICLITDLKQKVELLTTKPDRTPNATKEIAALEKKVEALAKMVGDLRKECGSEELEGAVGGEDPEGATRKSSSNELKSMGERVAVFDSISETHNQEIHNLVIRVDDIESSCNEIKENRFTLLQTKVREVEHEVKEKDQQIAELKIQIRNLETTSYDGTLHWKVTDVRRRREEAHNGAVTSIYSPPFFTSKAGYKMCARLYFNGDGMGRGTHMGLYFVVMKGEHDDILSWPFQHKVTLSLLDFNKRVHVSDTFKPDRTSSSFLRPVTSMNIASGCPLFCQLTKLDNSGASLYIKNDTMYIRIVVDLTDM